MEKPSLPKGTRDFGPVVMAKRQFILDSIKKVFQKYGFQPLETPAMENLSTLTGKYGEEGDQLLFKIIDSGEYQKNLVDSNSFKELYKSAIQDQTFINTLLSNKLLKTFHGLELALERLSRWVFLSGKESRDPKEICRLIDSGEEFFFNVLLGIQLDRSEKNNLSDFIKQKDIYLANSLIDFYNNASVYKENYEEKHKKQFHQYIENSLIPLFAEDLNKFLLEKNLEVLKGIPSSRITPEISEKGLRYDLTVPFARYVVMNRHEIALPFKRYQIQPVWRADRPQKGRYREFYQCDADVVGTDSLICEAEIILMIKEVFKSLKISDYSIKVNHRGILSGLAEVAGAKENETALFVAIDKLDKIGEEKVKEELRTKGFDDKSLNAVFEILNKQGSTATKVDLLTQNFSASDKGKKGIADLSAVLQLLKDYGVSEDHVEFDISLARGLSYYTGCIFEVKINNVAIGSVSGGGRYDNLTQAFGAKEILSGVGISFGVDRLFDAMEELKLFPDEAQISSTVLITHFDSESQRYGLSVLQTLRSNNIAAEIYPDTIKIQKQLDYANKKMIPYVIVIGSEEVKSGLLAFKNMKTGAQTKIGIEDILNTLKSADGRKQ
jgi:histidyl-tRNA synthetase